jgi:transmembrane sensor
MTKMRSAMAMESREEIENMAAEFLRRRRFGNWGEAERAELESWLRESEARHVAFLRLEAVLARIERLAALRTSKSKRGTRMAPLRFMMPFLASAVSLALVAMFGIPYATRLMQPPDRTYSTDVGGHALIKFTDRTQIELNTDTLVRYRMTTAERIVWLEKGEAWFRVAHDASRPFNVIVGNHRVTDLGTEFSIRRGSEGMELTLLKGRAALSGEGAQIAMLKPGDDAVVTPVSMAVARKTPQQLADALAWRRGMLVFRNARLADAVREFNRYNRTKLVIADPSVADLKFSVEIQNDNFEDFLQLAQTVLKLRVDREGNDVFLFRGAEQKSKKAVRVKHGE